RALPGPLGSLEYEVRDAGRSHLGQRVPQVERHLRGRHPRPQLRDRRIRDPSLQSLPRTPSRRLSLVGKSGTGTDEHQALIGACPRFRETRERGQQSGQTSSTACPTAVRSTASASLAVTSRFSFTSQTQGAHLAEPTLARSTKSASPAVTSSKGGTGSPQ